MADLDGISYLRTTRADTPVVYAPDEEFRVGGSKTLRDGDDVTIVAAGITLHEALKAADVLDGDGVSAQVIDPYSVKPLDADTLRAAAAATGAIVTVEDHWAEGGLGEAVLTALAEATSGRASRSSRCASCPGRGSRPSCSRRPASTPTTSRTPRARRRGRGAQRCQEGRVRGRATPAGPSGRPPEGSRRTPRGARAGVADRAEQELAEGAVAA